jgi:hypothetical protein
MPFKREVLDTQSKKTIPVILTKYVVYRRHGARHVSTIPPALSEPRVRDAAVFETTGIGMAGPLFLKDCRNVWGCLYTCAVYRAVHLELTSSLSTESFLQTFRRFVAHRGRPAIIYSDNGTNFMGTDRAFRQLDWEKILKPVRLKESIGGLIHQKLLGGPDGGTV